MKYCSILSENTQVSECVWAGELGVDGMSPSVSRGEIRRQNNLRPLPLCTRSVIPSFCWYIMPWFGFSGQALTLQFSTWMIKEEMKNVYKGEKTNVGDNIRLQGRESEICSFNFYMLNICLPKCYVLMFVVYVLASWWKLPVSGWCLDVKGARMI